MNTVKTFLFGLAMTGLLAAQTPPKEADAKPEPRYDQRIFQLKYADPRAVSDVLSVFGYSIRANRDLHVVSVSAPAGAMAAVEDAIRRLDVPAAAPKDIDLTVYLVVASSQNTGSSELPGNLKPVADQLKGILSYKNFRVLDSVYLRTQPGSNAHTKGLVVETGGAQRIPYELNVRPSSVTEDPNGHLIRLEQLNLTLQLPGNATAGVNTEITVREGQTVVVGKSNMGSPDQALILVVTAKVAE
jgi:hypothetical protein